MNLIEKYRTLTPFYQQTLTACALMLHNYSKADDLLSGSDISGKITEEELL